jgi:hypothetical protein
MKMLGEWNWYLPRWLEWLPRIGGEWSAEPEQAAKERGQERRGEPSPAFESD